MEAETGWRSEAKEHRSHQMPEEARKDPPLECGLANTWFQSSGLQHCERINFCCFQPCSVWSFVTAATGNQCKDQRHDTLHNCTTEYLLPWRIIRSHLTWSYFLAREQTVVSRPPHRKQGKSPLAGQLRGISNPV